MDLLFSGTRLNGSRTITMGQEAVSGSLFQQSSFASHSITSERNVVPVKNELPPEMLAAIPCGVQTGAGTVGLSAVMAARLVGASPLIAVDILDGRLNLALELGAAHALSAKEDSLAARIREIAPRGVDFSLETSANEHALNQAIACLTTGGQ